MELASQTCLTYHFNSTNKGAPTMLESRPVPQPDPSRRYTGLLQGAYGAWLLQHEGEMPYPARRFFDLGPRNMPELLREAGASTWRTLEEWSVFADAVEHDGFLDPAPVVLETVDRFLDATFRHDELLDVLGEIADRAGVLLESVICVAVLHDLHEAMRQHAHANA